MPFDVPAPEPPKGRRLGDVPATRRAIYDSTLKSIQALEPLTDGTHELRLVDAQYIDPDSYDPETVKKARLGGETLARRVRGTWQLKDLTSGNVLDQRQQIIAAVPHLTDDGTTVRRGVDYSLNHQTRSNAGLFTRRRQSGVLEAHANVLPGTGPQHRYTLDPDKGVFRVEQGQATMPLFPLLKALGATPEEMEKAWGKSVYSSNYSDDQPGALAKLAGKLLRRSEFRDATPEQYPALLAAAFQRMRMDQDVNRRTVGVDHPHLSKEALLAATSKLLRIHKGEEPPDSRDDLSYQTIVGPEDLFPEQIRKDTARSLRNAFFKAGREKNLQKFPSGVLNAAIDRVLLDVGLSQTPEETNPLELLDKQTRVTKLGEGGISGGEEAVPAETRDVSGSHLGYVDPIRSPESFRAGIDLNFAHNTIKGDDGRLYTQFRDARTGQMAWKSPRDLADTAVTFPGVLAKRGDVLPAIKNGKIGYFPREEIGYELPHFRSTFSHLSNLVPLVNMVKGQRVAMAARMFTQALPLENPEAPYVQSGVPERADHSFEHEYGPAAGAVTASRAGRVLDVQEGKIRLRHEDGSESTVPLHVNSPWARKTFLHQTPVVRAGDIVQPGQLLADSNYTKNGRVALGLNTRVAYMPTGKNFEDAISISESYAKRLTSTHAYQHDLELTDRHRTGRNDYLKLFPSKYDNKLLSKLGDDGLIRVGETVERGQPLILAARERDQAANKVHKKGQKGFHDESIVWEHRDPGVVTDSFMGKTGPVVVVQSKSAARVGDKLCFDLETSMLTRRRGWVPVADVRLDDQLATLNPLTEELEWQQPTHLHAYDHTGPMYELKTKHLDMLVTPNHRLWAHSRRETSFRAVEAQEVFKSETRWRFKKDCRWTGVRQKWMTFDTSGYSPRTKTLARIPMDDWLEFLGYYLSEGWCHAPEKGGGYVKIGQYRKSPHWTKINALLTRMGLPYRYNKHDGRFELGNRWLCDQLAPLGDSYTKYVPDYVQGLDKRQLRIFFEAYLNGDGHRGDAWEFGSSSLQLMTDLQVICLKLGWAARVQETTRTDNWSKAPHWRCRVNRTQLQPWLTKNSRYPGNSERMVAYEGKVYCVTVPNHIIYVARRDKTYWSLNSGRYG